MERCTFFDEDIRLEKIAKLDNPLDRLSCIDWEIFRPLIQEVIDNNSTAKPHEKNCGGRPSYDSLKMFKILVLQKIYNLSDEQTGFQLLDRLFFLNFVGLRINIPDFTTVWKFREKLVKSGVIEKLFDLFKEQLLKKNLILKTDCIIDASFGEVPRQRNTREKNAEIKDEKTPEDWKNEHKISHKDTDARWTVKGGSKNSEHKIPWPIFTS